MARSEHNSAKSAHEQAAVSGEQAIGKFKRVIAA